MVKKRTSGGGLGVILAQHFDTGIDLVRRLTGELVARFDKIGTDSDPQIVTGTIGRRMGSFLMQLVASPSTRPAYGHLWGLGGVAAIHNGDGTATPILDAWANKDTDIAALTVDVGTQSVSAGDVGVIMRGSNEDAQSLVFLKGGSGSGGGSGTAGDYGNGIDGAMTFGKNTSNDPLVACYGSVSGVNFTSTRGFVSGSDWVVFLCRPAFFTDLTIDAGVFVYAPYGVWCTGTLTVNGGLTTGGDAFACLAVDDLTDSLPGGVNNPGGVGGANANGVAGTASSTCPYDEGADFFGRNGGPDLSKLSGAGGNAGGHTGGSGNQGGHRGTQPGDTANGIFWTSSFYQAFPGSWLAQFRIGGSFDISGGAGGGGGAAGVNSLGGSGGYGGGLLYVAAKHLAGTGRIDANGGRGQPGDPGSLGAAAGGGGANGGAVYVLTDDSSFGSLAVTASPGVGGAGINGGANGVAGGATGPVTLKNPSR